MFWWFLNCWVSIWAIQEKELIRLKCEAKLKGGFYVTGGQTFVYHSHSWVSFHVWLLRYMNLYGRLPGSYILEFGTYSIIAMHPKTRKILQLLRLRQVLHETHPSWYYTMVIGYCGFCLCLCNLMVFLIGYCWIVWNLEALCWEDYDKLIWNYAWFFYSESWDLVTVDLKMESVWYYW